MHREVEQVETDHVDDEMDLPESFTVHAARDLREPVVEPGEESGQAAADDRVVEMADDPEGAPERRVERDGGVEHAGHAADDEQAQRSDREEHRGGESDGPAAQGEDVRQDDDRERD